jgi:hypothetical protein
MDEWKNESRGQTWMSNFLFQVTAITYRCNFSSTCRILEKGNQMDDINCHEDKNPVRENLRT